MDSETIFVIVITAGALGMLAYLELKSRRQRDQAPRPMSPEPNPNAKPEGNERRHRRK